MECFAAAKMEMSDGSVWDHCAREMPPEFRAKQRRMEALFWCTHGKPEEAANLLIEFVLFLPPLRLKIC